MKRWSTVFVTAVAVVLGAISAPAVSSADVVGDFLDVSTVAVPRADCGPGSLPETGLQGDVPAADRNDGRSTQGYRCNVSMIGQFQGPGAGILSANYDRCSYTGAVFPGGLLGPHPGVQVVDASDPAHPIVSTSLTEPAMMGNTWETLKVHTGRKLLAGAAVPANFGGGYVSFYDVSDCAHPRLLNTGPGSNLGMPMPFLSHEAGFSPDGLTWWSSGIVPGTLAAFDITDPARPRILWQGFTGIEAHGFGISPDGNRMYLSNLAGVTVLDTSQIQSRNPYAQVPHLGHIFWSDGQLTQHSVPVSYDGKNYIFTADEAGSGGVKLLDVSDDMNPRVVNKVKLEINLPQNQAEHFKSAAGGSLLAYEAHYCSADRQVNPTALACGWMTSGIRVFDIRDPHNIREIAYFNPPAQTNKNLQLLNSAHSWVSIIGQPFTSLIALARGVIQNGVNPFDIISNRSLRVAFGDISSDLCLSPPTFKGSQLWVTCSDNGFMALQLDNEVYAPPPNQSNTMGS